MNDHRDLGGSSGGGVFGYQAVELSSGGGQEGFFHEVPAGAAAVVQVVADGFVLDFGGSAEGGKQLGQELQLPDPFAGAAGIEDMGLITEKPQGKAAGGQQ